MMRELSSQEIKFVAGGELSVSPFEATIGFKLQSILGMPVLLGAIGACGFGVLGAMVFAPVGLVAGLCTSYKFVLGDTYYLICDEDGKCKTVDSQFQPI